MIRKMTNIYIVLSGGTICTEAEEKGDDKVRSISEKAGTLLQQIFFENNPQYLGKVQFECSRNFKILSENMTIDKWNLLIDFFRENEKTLKGHDGIIIAHGTDTLAYSCSIFSLLLRNIGIPVFFVSSNEPLDYPNANGNENFKSAVECITNGIAPNVYAVYRNTSSGRLLLHLASRLEQCKNYEEDFYSKGAVDITDIPDSEYGRCFDLLIEHDRNNSLEYDRNNALEQDKNNSLEPADVRKNFYSVRSNKDIGLDGDWHLKDCVLRITPYVGLRYDSFEYSKYKAILHGTYHSGTVCVDDEKSSASILYLIEKCKNGPDIYLSPAKKTGDIYASVKDLSEHADGRVYYLYGCTIEMAYVKLLLAYALKVKDVSSFMSEEVNFENAYK